MASLNSHTQTGYTQIDDVSAKHSFMKNPELKAMTFFHLNDPSLGSKDQYLLNAALTCKDFLHVALDALWEKLNSLVPLLQVLPALRFEDEAYVLSGIVSQADWDRLQYYSRKVKFFEAMLPDNPRVHPSTYFRIAQFGSTLFPSLRRLQYSWADISSPDVSGSYIFLFLSPLLESLVLSDFGGFENTIVGPFLASFPSQMLNRIVLDGGQMSADILKKSIVHFKQLRSLELIDAVFMTDFVLWEVLGTLPSLENLTLEANIPASHPAHAPENSNSQSGGAKYFDALESLRVTGSFFLIQHLLNFIDSPCLTSIEVYPLAVIDRREHDPELLFTTSMTIVVSKWSHSLKKLAIGSSPRVHHDAISKCFMLFADLHEMQTFHFSLRRMKNLNDDIRHLVKMWPKLRSLRLPLSQSKAFISLSTLRIVAENCPELRHLSIQLDTSTIPPFDISSKSLHHNLKVLTVGRDSTIDNFNTLTLLTRQIQVARHLDLMFPYLKSIGHRKDDVFWSGTRDLVNLCQDASLSRVE